VDKVLGWLPADDQPQEFLGADTTPFHQCLQTGTYSNSDDGHVIPVSFGTTRLDRPCRRRGASVAGAQH